MTTLEIKELVLGADPDAKRYASSREDEAFTVWAEYERIHQPGMDYDELGWRFEIDRYAKEPEDEIAQKIERALFDDVRVAYRYEVAYEIETGYIRHIFSCEGV